MMFDSAVQRIRQDAFSLSSFISNGVKVKMPFSLPKATKSAIM